MSHWCAEPHYALHLALQFCVLWGVFVADRWVAAIVWCGFKRAAGFFDKGKNLGQLFDKPLADARFNGDGTSGSRLNTCATAYSTQPQGG